MIMKGQSYTSTPPMYRTACTEPQCLYKGDLYLYLFILVPWSWKGRAISLLHLWAILPVQSLSACTMVHFTFTLPLLNGTCLQREKSGPLQFSYVHLLLYRKLHTELSSVRYRQLALQEEWLDINREAEFVIILQCSVQILRIREIYCT
jgi:hypothetical protein